MQQKNSANHRVCNLKEMLLGSISEKQKKAVEPVLQVLDGKSQVILSCCLLNYINTGVHTPPEDMILGVLYYCCLDQMGMESLFPVIGG